MRHLPPNRSRRKAAIAPLAAFLMIPVLVLIACGVDLGYVYLVKSDLQNVADAAALAGVQAMQQPFTEWVPPSSQRDALRTQAIAAAKDAAKKFAALNTAGGTSITLLDGDIECGYVDAQGNYTATPPTSVFPNTVRLVARRDEQANNPISLFFAPVVGVKNLAVTGVAGATMYAGQINTLKANTGINARILPMTYDVDHWTNFLKTGKDPDGNTTVAADGAAELQVYPSIKYKGNFGELSLNDANTGTNDVKTWINSGMSDSDRRALAAAHLIPLCFHDITKWDWPGNSGFRAVSASDVNNYTGQTFLLPLYTAKDSRPDPNYAAGVGQGSNYFFNIVDFVPVKIMPVSDPNQQIVVQPNGYIDPDAVFLQSTIAPAGSVPGTAYATSLTTPKLSK